MTLPRKRRQSLIPLMGLAVLVLGIFLCVGTSLVLFGMVSTLRGSRRDIRTTTTRTAKKPQAHPGSLPQQQQQQQQQQQRLAILLPFVGKSVADIPPYMELFCTGAVGIATVADVLLIHNGVLATLEEKNDNTCATATNIRFVNLQSTQDMMELVATRLLDKVTEWKIPPTQFVPFLARHTQLLPYTLVEYKPALGHVFADYIGTYSHWAYSDLDILWGDLQRHLTTADWNDFDLVTLTFGDQERLYLRGQFTMHRNDAAHINQLWRNCRHLSRMDERFATLVRQRHDFTLESAEGCYSAVVLQDKDIAIKYVTAAWTDIDRADMAYTTGIQVLRDVAKRRHLLVKRGKNNKSDPTTSLDQQQRQLSYHRLSTNVLYRDESLPWKEPIGAMEPIDLPSSHDEESATDGDPCRLFWIRPQYRRQLCLTTDATVVTVHAHETVYWVKGQLYKQQTRDLVLGHDDAFITAPFFHFQEWKRHYESHQLMAVLDPHWSSFLLTQHGALPIQYNDPTFMKMIRKRQPHQLSSPLGLSLDQWKASERAFLENGSYRSSLLPRHVYCLRSAEPQQYHAIPCQDAVQWYDTERIRLVSTGTAWNQVKVDTEATLCLTFRITRHDATVTAWSKLIQLNLDNWQGQPAVVVVSLLDVAPDMAEQILAELQEAAKSYAATALVAVIMPKEEEEEGGEKKEEDTVYPVSRKTLINMAVDMSPTRWYVCGLELERGLVLSRDSVVLALRAVETSVQSGRMLWIPQFALNQDEAADNSLGIFNDASSISLKELVEAESSNAIQLPWHLDSPCDNNDKVGHSLTSTQDLWWRLSKVLLEPEQKPGTDANISQRAQSMEEMNREVMKLLDSPDVLLSMQESPILLVDNAGPYLGVRANTFARQIEAFAGASCFNLLQMTLLAAGGYQLDVLEGAFAISSPKTRQSEDQLSRCDACPIMTGHGKARDSLVQSEIRRIVNTAIVWENPPSTLS